MDSPYIPIKFKSPNPSKEEVAAVQPFVSFLEDFRAGSLTTLPSLVLPNARVLNLRPVPSGYIQVSIGELLERLDTVDPGQKVAEPIYDVEVWIDGKIGVAWTPYDFFVTVANGEGKSETKMTHRGTDIIFLANVGGEWKISGIADNCRVVHDQIKLPGGYEGPETQDPEEEKVVLGLFKEVIKRICNHDYQTISELLLPGSRFTFHRGNEVVVLTMEEFVKTCHEAFDGKVVREELLDVTIRIDDDVALIWSPYRFTAGENVTFGSDMVTLAKLEGKWLITGIGNNNGGS